MKLPVKLLTAVAALALLVVGVVSVQNAGNTVYADVTGAIHLTNRSNGLTTNSSPPSGRTFVGSGKTLYSTMLVGGDVDPQNTILNNSDFLIVTVADSDIDEPIPATHDFILVSVGANDSQTVTVPAAQTPIIGSVSVWWDVDDDGLYEPAGDDSTGDRTSEFGIGVLNAGNGTTQNGVVSLTNDGTGISGTLDGDTFFLVYQTSAIDVLDVEIQTPVSGPALLTLVETGRSTGVFEGFVQLVDNEFAAGAFTSATKASSATVCNPGGSPAVITGCETAEISVADNLLVTARYADDENNNGANQTVTRTARVETSAPVPVVSSPANGSATQSRNITFSGTVSDTGSGLDVSTVTLFYDDGNDAPNDDTVLDVTGIGGNVGSIASVATGTGNPTDIALTLTGSPADGASTGSWSHSASSLPLDVVGQPDHILDFQVTAFDLAGNVGFSDSDTSTNDEPGPGPDGREAHTVKIDQIAPDLDEAFTGHTWNSEDEAIEDGVGDDGGNNRRTIRVLFDDDVTGVDNTDFEVELESGTTLIPTNAQVFSAAPDSVFLTVASDIPSDDQPTVTIVGQINDAAGNSQSAGSVIADDNLAPVITVALSGGTGLGTGSSGPTGLTSGTMVITVTSDELLSSSPTVQIYNEGATVDATPTAINQGSNVYRATYTGAGADGDKSVRVSANDASSSGSRNRVVGSTDVDASSAITFEEDGTDPELINDGGTVTTSQRKPFVVIEFDDENIVTIDVATVGGTDVSGDLATTDNKKFFFVPTGDLALGDLTVEGRATDLANNQGPLGEYTLTIGERAAFSLQLFAGWNAKSLPSNPVDPDITSVFTNTAVDQVVAYNAMDTASPWRIATRDAVSGAWTSSTSTPLNSIRTGNGYWIHTNNFAPQEVELEGAVAPGAGSPPPVVTIPTARGWNFVGIVSQSRAQTVGASGATLERITAGGGTNTIDVSEYFNTVDQGRVYRYDPSELRFEELTSVDGVEIGEALWVFISPQADGSFPAIVP